MTTLEQKSKLLSRWLRHRPDAIGIEIDKRGWVDVAELLLKSASAGVALTKDELMQIVLENDKQRFSLSEDRTRIRAAQGHSVDVDLKLPVKTPPPVLFHGTVQNFIASIRRQGLTTSLEDVGGKVYKVYRSKYCSSGATGEPLRKGTQGRYYRKESSSGDYYVILKTGELGVYDRDGQIDALPKHPGLYPRK